MSKVSRRDFLKFTALGAAALAARPLLSSLASQRDSTTPNIFIFVFDAWSAHHLKLHGYPRDTMPNLTRFAERAFVYHNHYSAGSYTVPGTASLLTSLYPWTHRALQLTANGVAPQLREQNIFAVLGSSLATLGYSQNPYADIFLHQFRQYLDQYLPEDAFNLERRLRSAMPIFANDSQMAFASFENNILRDGKGAFGSLYGGIASRFYDVSKETYFQKKYSRKYPVGLPTAGSGVFLLEKVINDAAQTISQFDSPTFAYFHFYPPHEPYTPRAGFETLFNDGWKPAPKPIHPLSTERFPEAETLSARLRYDQYLAAWDAEFARMLSYLELSGLLEKSIIVITSDHGELFERGEIDHMTPLLARPIVHIPFFISLPGQTERKDVHTVTSSLDVLPTLANLIGADAPFWTEGRLLPGLGGVDDPDRSVYSIDAKTSSSFSALNKFSISLIKHGYRLIHYRYPNYSKFEFYSLGDDPEELTDLFPSNQSLAKAMKEELLQKIQEFNDPYQS